MNKRRLHSMGTFWAVYLGVDSTNVFKSPLPEAHMTPRH